LPGFAGGAEDCTTCDNPRLADLAVLSIYHNISDNKLIIYQFKRGFFVGSVLFSVLDGRKIAQFATFVGPQGRTKLTN